MEDKKRKLTGIEKTIARNLRNSVNNVPHAAGSYEVNMDQLVALKKKYKEQGKRLSTTSLFVKAVGVAMQEHPHINSRLEGDELIQYASVNVGIGVDTPKGLLVVVLKDAQAKSLDQISDEVNALIDKARENKCTMDDITGSTITISNMSMTEIVSCTSIVNNNESLIIGFGRIKKEVYVDDNDKISIANIGRIIYNMNHAATTGMPINRFMISLKKVLENPQQYMM